MIKKNINKDYSSTFFQKLTSHKYFHEFTITSVLVVIVIILSILTPKFLTINNLFIVLNQVSMTTILALGMALVLISGGIDLSISGILVLTGIPVIYIINYSKGNLFTTPAVIIGAILFGGFIGLINGINIVYLKITAFIATLATMLIAQGLMKTITGGKSIGEIGLMPKSFLVIGTGAIGPIPITVIIMLVVLIFFIYLTEKTPFGRSVYFIGGNEEIAKASGINVRKIKVLVYLISGICAGIAGLIFTSKHASAQPWAENPYLFDSITAAILGGVALGGGSGNMIGVFIGSLIIGVINNGQDILGVNPYLRWVITGFIVIIVVITSSLTKKQNL